MRIAEQALGFDVYRRRLAVHVRQPQERALDGRQCRGRARGACAAHRITRLMREASLRARHGYRTRRVGVAKLSVLIPLVLQRHFTVTRRYKAWVTDMAQSVQVRSGSSTAAEMCPLYPGNFIGHCSRAVRTCPDDPDRVTHTLAKAVKLSGSGYI